MTGKTRGIDARSVYSLAFLDLTRPFTDLREFTRNFVVTTPVPDTDGQVERGWNEAFPLHFLVGFDLPNEEREEQFPDPVNHECPLRNLPEKPSHHPGR